MDKLLTIDELAEVLTVKKSTIYQWVHLGLIPHIKVGRLLRFREEDIQKWLISRKVEPSARFRAIL
jgi:excisionase family DNA binding protein